jgi:anti-anti-sigma factor
MTQQLTDPTIDFATDDTVVSADPSSRWASVARRTEEGLSLSLTGAFDASTAASMRPMLDSLLDGQEARVIIDLRDLRLLDRAGVREILRVVRALRARGAWAVVQGARGQPLAILNVLRLDEQLLRQR